MLHAAAVRPFLAMREAAALAGFDVVPVSSFRDFGRQRAIWNAKFRGERRALDRAGRPLDILTLDAGARVETILLWSALPGASRHHWGSDVDVADGKAMASGYAPKLELDEYRRGGPFAALSAWLGANMRRFGFYRPYTRRGRGVQPEPWHLSYAPVAARAQAAFSVEGLRGVLAAAAIDGREEVLANLPRTFESYVVNVDAPPEAALLSPRLA